MKIIKGNCSVKKRKKESKYVCKNKNYRNTVSILLVYSLSHTAKTSQHRACHRLLCTDKYITNIWNTGATMHACRRTQHLFIQSNIKMPFDTRQNTHKISAYRSNNHKSTTGSCCPLNTLSSLVHSNFCSCCGVKIQQTLAFV